MWFSEYKAVITGTRDTNNQRSLSSYEALIGGMSAGCFSTILNNPVDFLKTRMQVERVSNSQEELMIGHR